MAKNAPILLSGTVYCDWNAFTFVSPMPDRLQTGDLVIWSWSGDSKKPSSKSQSGLLRVSVFDGKNRRLLKVKHTRVHHVLRYRDEAEREKRLGPLVSELRALKGRYAIIATRGYEVAPVSYAAPPVVPPKPKKTPTKSTTAARIETDKRTAASTNTTATSGAASTTAASNTATSIAPLPAVATTAAASPSSAGNNAKASPPYVKPVQGSLF